jgi:serine protease Do
MKNKIVAGLVGLLALALATEGVFAQKSDAHVSPRARTTSVWSMNAGQARLGVRIADVTADQARELKLPGEYGAVVNEVEEGSAAEKAGLKAKDVILEFDGERVRSAAELRRLVDETPPGRTVEVKVSRDGQIHNLRTTPDTASSTEVMPRFEMPNVEIPRINIPNFRFNFMPGGARLGISGEDLNPQLAKYFGVASGKGVLVLEVEPGSAAEKAGLKAGDCIIRAGSDPVENLSELRRALDRNSNQKREVALAIVRDHHEQTISVELEPSTRMYPNRVAENKLRHENRFHELWRPAI